MSKKDKFFLPRNKETNMIHSNMINPAASARDCLRRGYDSSFNSARSAPLQYRKLRCPERGIWIDQPWMTASPLSMSLESQIHVAIDFEIYNTSFEIFRGRGDKIQHGRFYIVIKFNSYCLDKKSLVKKGFIVYNIRKKRQKNL